MCRLGDDRQRDSPMKDGCSCENGAGPKSIRRYRASAPHFVATCLDDFFSEAISVRIEVSESAPAHGCAKGGKPQVERKQPR
jgi:hypothetical protein